jgi:hypothetical protein
MFDPENEGTTLYLEVANGVNFGRPESQQHRSENLKFLVEGTKILGHRRAKVRAEWWTKWQAGVRAGERAGGRANGKMEGRVERWMGGLAGRRAGRTNPHTSRHFLFLKEYPAICHQNF